MADAVSQKWLDDWLDWREAERNKHRIMTLYEYRIWLIGGDAISCPTSSDSFPGGLTITGPATPYIVGRKPNE